MRRFLSLLLVASALCTSALAVTLYNPDTFDGGSFNGWQNNAGNTGISNEPGGGNPFLRVEGFGANGNPSRLAMFNQSSKYTGDYITAGVTGFTARIRNLSSTQISMRLVMSDGNGGRWTSTTATMIAGNADWADYFFGISESSLTQVLGFDDYATSLSSITQIQFRHQSGAPTFNGTAIEAAAGFDNIQAVPEPASLTLLSLGLAAMIRKSKR